MKPLICCLLLSISIAAAPAKQRFTGVITDSMCATANHSQMQMGPTDAECTIACIREHGAEYVFFDGTHVYALSDQKAPEQFAGKKVTVVGTLDEKTHKIKVDSIKAAK